MNSSGRVYYIFLNQAYLSHFFLFLHSSITLCSLCVSIDLLELSNLPESITHISRCIHSFHFTCINRVIENTWRLYIEVISFKILPIFLITGRSTFDGNNQLHETAFTITLMCVIFHYSIFRTIKLYSVFIYTGNGSIPENDQPFALLC